MNRPKMGGASEQVGSVLFLKQRPLRRWPPLMLHPKDDGRGNLEFVQRGSSVAAYLIGAGVMFAGLGPVLWSITGGMGVMLPVMFSAAGVVMLAGGALLARSTLRLALLVHERRAVLRYKIGPISREVASPLDRVELRTHRAELLRRWSANSLPWKGHIAVIAAGDAIMFPIAASKERPEIIEYLQRLPQPIAGLPLVEGPVILASY